MFKLKINALITLPQSGGVPHLQHSHGKNAPHRRGLPGPADLGTRLGEVPHLSCVQNQGKKINFMEKLVTPPLRQKPAYEPEDSL